MKVNEPVYTLDFQKELEMFVPEYNDRVDMRNLIYVRGATLTKEAYYGYTEYLKKMAMSSPFDNTTYMLRLGFIPLVMAPSFWGERAHEMILPIIPKSLPYYPRPSVGFRNPYFRSDFPDIWVSKLDAAKLCGCRPEQVTVKGVLEKCGL